MDDLATVAEDSARGGFFLISGTAISTVILAISAILIGRVLGPELYGQYTLALVVPQLLYLFADFGINQGIIKFTSSLRVKGEKYRLKKIVKYGLMLKTITGMAIFAVNFVLADWFASQILQRPDLTFQVRLASTGILFQVIFITATSAFVGLDRAEYNAVATNIQSFSKTIIQIALILLGLGVTGAVIGHVASFVVGGAAGLSILFVILREKDETNGGPEVREVLKTLVRYGAPLYVSLLLTGFIPAYQNVVLAIFTTDADIGNFRAAQNFAALMTVLAVPITTALLPAFSKLDSSTIQDIKAFFKLSNKYTAMLIVPITVLLIVYSTAIIQIIYGSTFASAPLFLATYCLLYFLVGLGYLTLASFYNGLGETRISMMISLITFLLLAILSPFLTSAYGVSGLIVAFLTGSAAGTVYGSYTARRRFHIEFDMASLAKTYLVSIVAALPSVLMLRLVSSPFVNLVAGGFLYLLIYVTLVPLAKVVSLHELQMARAITQKIPLLRFIARPIFQYEGKLLKFQTRAESESQIAKQL
jgi:O-antigen/teichoic acid export membrane protein